MGFWMIGKGDLDTLGERSRRAGFGGDGQIDP